MQETSAALIEQLVYFDNFMLGQETPNLDMDGQLSLDLAAFADDSFVFADEDKPDPQNMNDMDDNDRNDLNQGPSSRRPMEDREIHENNDLQGTEAFKEGNIQPESTDAFSLGIEDSQRQSTLSLSEPWFAEKPAESTRANNAEGNQLHSILNDKIEATKRHKFHNHVGHSALANHSASDPFSVNSLDRRNLHTAFVQAQIFDDAQAANVNGNETLDTYRSRNHIVDPNLNNNENHIPPRNGIGNGHNQTQDAHVRSEQNLTSEQAGIPDLSHMPKYPVPPGAKSSLKKAGLSQNQIDLLSALIAQHQTSLKTETGLTQIGEPTSSLHTPLGVVPTLVSSASFHSSHHTDHVKESDRYPLNGVAHVTQALSLMTSPMSTYGSEHSTESTMSMVDSPRRESSSANPSDANGSGLDLTKRKRNTAASARFRVKKKMKEKEMEIKILQLGDMIQKFEIRIDELEMENRFLKNLVIEKGNRASDEELRLLKDKAKYIDVSDRSDADDKA